MTKYPHLETSPLGDELELDRLRVLLTETTDALGEMVEAHADCGCYVCRFSKAAHVRLSEGIRGYEYDAKTEALYKRGDRVIVQSDLSLPARPGRVRWRRWEHGNNCWAYAVDLDIGIGTAAIEKWLSPA